MPSRQVVECFHIRKKNFCISDYRERFFQCFRIISGPGIVFVDKLLDYVTCDRVISNIWICTVFPGVPSLKIGDRLISASTLACRKTRPKTFTETDRGIKTHFSVHIHIIYAIIQLITGEGLLLTGKSDFRIRIFFTRVVDITTVYHIIRIYNLLRNSHTIPAT